MKKGIITLMFILGLAITSFGQVNPNSTYVNGYYRQNGTYVNGYYKTTPNNTINDNYSTSPNVNPYTGEQGTVQPEYNYDYTAQPPITTPKKGTDLLSIFDIPDLKPQTITPSRKGIQAMDYVPIHSK